MKNKVQMEVQDELEIDLFEIFGLFRQKLKYIIVLLVLGGILGGLGSLLFIDPTYQATAKLYVVSTTNESGVSLSDLQIGTTMTADCETLVVSRPVLEGVIENLGLDGMTPEKLKEQIRVNNPTGTRILEVIVSTTDPELSMEIANEVVNEAVVWLPEVMGDKGPNIAEEAALPTKKTGPSYVMYAMLGAVAVAFIYCAICLIQYIRDDSIRNDEALERYFGIVPLAAIPEETVGTDTNYTQKRSGIPGIRKWRGKKQ